MITATALAAGCVMGYAFGSITTLAVLGLGRMAAERREQRQALRLARAHLELLEQYDPEQAIRTATGK